MRTMADGNSQTTNLKINLTRYYFYVSAILNHRRNGIKRRSTCIVGYTKVNYSPKIISSFEISHYSFEHLLMALLLAVTIISSFFLFFSGEAATKAYKQTHKKTNKLYSCVIMIIKPLLRSYHSIATNFYSEVYTYVLQCAKCVYITFTISLNRGAAKCQQQFHWVKRNK